jgi:hypothetical protein
MLAVYLPFVPVVRAGIYHDSILLINLEMSIILKDEALETSIFKEALETVLTLRIDYCLFNALNMKVSVNH